MEVSEGYTGKYNLFQTVQNKNVMYINIKRKQMIKQMRPNVNNSLIWVKDM